MLFVKALRGLGAARTGAYFSTAPFVGAAVAILLFGEPVTGAFLAAAGLMAAGVWLHLGERHVHRHGHLAQSHSHRHRHDDLHHRHAHPGRLPGEAHEHPHRHEPISHVHYPDLEHRHAHHR